MPREKDDACAEFVARVERSETREVLRVTKSAPGFAEPVIGPRFARTRWLNPGYEWSVAMPAPL